MMDGWSEEIIPQVRPWLDAEERDAVAAVLTSGWITEGAVTEAFGAALNLRMGAEHGVFAPNGTLGLALGLMALGVGSGDEVLVPDTTFVGSATAVILAGATPVFVPVEGRAFQIDVERCAAFLSDRTRAVMPVHLYGDVCDMDAVIAFARQHDLFVIEDAAQAIGVTYKGRHAGTIGDVGCFSFFADKTITTGEGGYVVCREAAVHRRLLQLRNQGRINRGAFIHETLGFNFRIGDMQAAMGLAQLGKLDRIIERKRAHHARYTRGLAGIAQVRVLQPSAEASFVPFRCVLMADQGPALMEHLEHRGVHSRTVFPPLHRQPCFVDDANIATLDDERFDEAVHAFAQGVCLPVFPELTEVQIARIVRGIVEFYG